ncbi:hypothetical protein PCL_10772 [Purpureocillium lilacinum]|uniref:Uncharacterized protein n=1 Tax=Purpureocillium lilacinum TaxID=33203 RepID=A0A2U3ECB5_PURLI|nr:hypothetical protein PCL_10772 [Purpureocillium lilacinum]
MIPSSAGFPHSSSIAASCLSIPSGVAQVPLSAALATGRAELASPAGEGAGPSMRRETQLARRPGPAVQSARRWGRGDALGRHVFRVVPPRTLPSALPAFSLLFLRAFASFLFASRVHTPRVLRLHTSHLGSSPHPPPVSRLVSALTRVLRLPSSHLASSPHPSRVSTAFAVDTS